MDKTTFLRDLENALEGEVSQTVINDTLNYYNQYIVDEVNAGKTEEEVIRRLGSGNVIAKTIISAQEAKIEGETEEYGRSAFEQGFFSEREGRRSDAPEQKGFHMSMDSDGNVKLKYGKFQLNSWYGKLIGVLIAALFIAFVIMLVAGLFSLLWTLLPVFVLAFLIITLINFIAGR